MKDPDQNLAFIEKEIRPLVTEIYNKCVEKNINFYYVIQINEFTNSSTGYFNDNKNRLMQYIYDEFFKAPEKTN